MAFIRAFFSGLARLLGIVLGIVAVVVWVNDTLSNALVCGGLAAFFLFGSFALRHRPSGKVLADDGPLFPPGHERTVKEVLSGGGFPRVEMTYVDRPVKLAAEGGYGWDGRFFSKVAGVSHRQAAASRCQNGELLGFRREQSNAHDTNAIAVYSESGEQLGYLNARWAKTMAPLLDRGLKIRGRITCVTGSDGKTVGINIEVWGVGGPPINDDI